MRTDPTTEATTTPHEITRKLIQEHIDVYYNPEQKHGTRERDIYFAAEQIQPEERLMRVHVEMESMEDSEDSCDDLKTQLMYIINEEIRPYYTTEENIEINFKK